MCYRTDVKHIFSDSQKNKIKHLSKAVAVRKAFQMSITNTTYQTGNCHTCRNRKHMKAWPGNKDGFSK